MLHRLDLQIDRRRTDPVQREIPDFEHRDAQPLRYAHDVAVLVDLVGNRLNTARPAAAFPIANRVVIEFLVVGSRQDRLRELREPLRFGKT